MKKVLAITFLLLVFSYSSIAQQLARGKVTDKKGRPLVSAIISEKESLNFTETDEDGDFEFRIEGNNIIITYIGYQAVHVEVDFDRIMSITLDKSEELTTFTPIEIVTVNILNEKEKTTTIPTYINKITQPANTQSVLNYVTGLHMQSGGLNTNKLTIRGIGGTSQFATTDVKTFYNDIPLHNNIGESAIEDFGLHMADRLEIIKGTTGSEYESGYGGAILLKNKNIKASNKFEIISNNTGGRWKHVSTQNQINLSRTNYKNSHNISFFHSYISDEGYRNNNQYDKNNLTLNYTFNKSGKFKLTTLLNWSGLRAFIPSSLNKEDYDLTPIKAASSWAFVQGFENYHRTLMGVNLDYTFNSEISLSNTIYGHVFGSFEKRPFNIIEEESDVYGIKGKLQYNRQKSDKVFTVGYRVQTESYDFELFDPFDTFVRLGRGSEKRNLYEIYGHLSTELNSKWSYKLEFNTQYANIRVKNNNVLNRAFLLPDGTLTYRNTNNSRIYLNTGRGINYFNPSQALLPDGNYNQDLTPSSAWSISLGTKGIFLDQIKYRFAIYNMWIDDLIATNRDTTNQPIYINSGTANYSGIELELKANLLSKNISDRKKLSVELHYNLMNNQYKEFISDGIDLGSNSIPGAPNQTLTGIIMGEYYGLFGNIRYRYVDAYQMRDDNSIKSEPYQLINATIGYNIKAGRWTITPRFDLINLGNEKYASMTLVNASSFGGNPPRYYYPGRPRHRLVSLNIKYSM